jgi:purine-binding chemotaxis protein CheW
VTISDGHSTSRKFAAIRLGERKFACDIFKVQEIVHGPELEPSFEGCEFQVGTYNGKRGSLPVIDLLNRPPDACPIFDMSLVVIEIGDSIIGLLADELCDVLSIDPMSACPLPGGACGVDEDLLDGVITISDIDYYLLDLHRILEAFLGAETRPGPDGGEK